MDWNKLNAWMASTLWPNQDEKDKVLRSWLEKQLEEETKKDTTSSEEGASPEASAETVGKKNPQEQQIFRMKGILSVKHNPAMIEDDDWLQFCDPTTHIDRRQFIVQGVYDLWEVYPSSNHYEDDEERINKLVVIGRYLQLD
jgi:G3E family GTPase